MMRSRRRDNLRLNRQSVYWYHSEETRKHSPFNALPDYHESHYTRMLIEDVHNGVMPYSGMTKWPLAARIEPSNPKAEDLIEGAISTRDYGSRLYEVVTKFVQDCTSWLMSYGNAIYEIAYLHDADDKPVAFKLLHILPASVKLESKKLKQCIPESVRRDLGIDANMIDLTPQNIIRFELPAYMRDDYVSMMSALYAQGSVATFPDFVMPSMKGEITHVPFDLNKFNRDQKMAVADATKEIGWNARQIPDDVFITEYYYLHRFLLFERFKVEVRNSILSALNEAIARAGGKLDFNGQIIVEGLPGLAEIRLAQNALGEGTEKFGNLMKPFHPYSS